jgi:hypothetical protein
MYPVSFPRLLQQELEVLNRQLVLHRRERLPRLCLKLIRRHIHRGSFDRSCFSAFITIGQLQTPWSSLDPVRLMMT